MSLIGFVGLGTMGAPMARNLGQGGFRVLGYRRTMAGEETEGVEVVDSLSALAECRHLILMLPDAHAVKDVLFGPQRFELKPGTTVINASTLAPEETVEIGERLEEAGVFYLETPVTGSRAQAEAAELAFLVGGAPPVLESCRPILLAMGCRIQRLGGWGSASAAKLGCNLIGAINLLAWCEGMHLGGRYGVSRLSFMEVVGKSGARSAIADAKGPGIVSREYPVAFRLALMAKDLRLALRSAGPMHLPILKAALEAYSQAFEQVGSLADVSAVNEIYE